MVTGGADDIGLQSDGGRPELIVSVVIPVLDRADTIDVAVRSVLGQTEERIEVIVVDDGSTDATVDIVRRIDDDRVKIVELGTNCGANAARNAGIAVANGRWIALQDSDDEWLARKLELQLAALGAEPAAVAAWCAMVVVDSTCTASKFVAYLPTESAAELQTSFATRILSHSIVSNQTLLMDGATLRRIGGYDETLPALQDWEMVIRLTQQGELAFVDEPLVIQRLSGDSISRSAEKRVRAREMILEKHRHLFEQHPAEYAGNLYMNAGGWRRLDQRDQAIDALHQTLAVRPFSLRARLMRTALLVPHADRVISAIELLLARSTHPRRRW